MNQDLRSRLEDLSKDPKWKVMAENAIKSGEACAATERLNRVGHWIFVTGLLFTWGLMGFGLFRHSMFLGSIFTCGSLCAVGYLLKNARVSR